MTLALSLFCLWLGFFLMEKVHLNASPKQKYVLLLLLLPIVIYPFEYGPIWWLRGLTGDLSMTSLSLLALALYRKLDDSGKITICEKERYLLMGLIAGIGLVFYPLALGLTSFDPYSLGYHNIYFVAVLLLLSLIIFLRKLYVFATILLLSVLAWNTQFLQSVNLWDYLIDPFVFFYALGSVVRCKT
ncbi:MAG: hypothetical protein R8M14_03005 [Ghiorsea sp.]